MSLHFTILKCQVFLIQDPFCTHNSIHIHGISKCSYILRLALKSPPGFRDANHDPHVYLFITSSGLNKILNWYTYTFKVRFKSPRLWPITYKYIFYIQYNPVHTYDPYTYIIYIFLKDITDITSKSHPLWRAYQKFPLLLKHPDDSTCIKADGHPLSWSSIGRHLSRKGFFGGSCGKVKQIFKNLVENDMCKLSLNMIFENDIWIWFYIQMSKLPKYHPRFIEHFFPLTLLFATTLPTPHPIKISTLVSQAAEAGAQCPSHDGKIKTVPGHKDKVQSSRKSLTTTGHKPSRQKPSSER